MNYQGLLRQMIGITLAMLILSACSIQANPTPTIMPSSTPIPISTATLDPSQSRTAILAAFKAQKGKSSIRTRSETVASDGIPHITVVESVSPDRFRIISDPIEYVITGEKVYYKEKDIWTLTKIPAATIIGGDSYKALEEGMSESQFVGVDTLNGKPVQVFQYNNKTKIGDTESIVLTKVWIDISDNLPYKMTLDGEIASVDSTTGKAVGVKAISTIIFEYDTTIKIDPPTIN